MMQNKIAIVGVGAAGLVGADRLSSLLPDAEITLYDAMPSPARKILMAGKSGLNITHSEPLDLFCQRYGAAAGWMGPMLADFGPSEVIEWMEGLGQAHFVGSSGRVFPKIFKASPLLRAILVRLEGRGVRLETRHRWRGWDTEGALIFVTAEGEKQVQADATLLALGGPSWPRLGTDGKFVTALEAIGLSSAPYRPANCGFDAAWSTEFSDKWAGEPIKSVRLSYNGTQSAGDFVITRNGVEGSAVYALSAALRDGLQGKDEVVLAVDLRPHQSLEAIEAKLSKPRGKTSLSNHLRKSLNLKGAQAALLKECTSKEAMSNMAVLARAIKALPIKLTAPRPLNEAISCAGGVRLDQLDDNMMVKKRPGLFLAGEMLDWEAPTGGYLLTGCFSQGYRAAGGIADYLKTLS